MFKKFDVSVIRGNQVYYEIVEIDENDITDEDDEYELENLIEKELYDRGYPSPHISSITEMTT